MILKYKSNISVLCLISIIFLLCSCAALSNNASQTKKMEKKPVVVMLSGFDGPMNYAVFSSRLTDLGYHVLLLDSRLLPRSDPAACRLALEREIKGALKSANAVSSKAVVIGYSLGGRNCPFRRFRNAGKRVAGHCLLSGYKYYQESFISYITGWISSAHPWFSRARRIPLRTVALRCALWAIATVAKARKRGLLNLWFIRMRAIASI